MKKIISSLLVVILVLMMGMTVFGEGTTDDPTPSESVSLIPSDSPTPSTSPSVVPSDSATPITSVSPSEVPSDSSTPVTSSPSELPSISPSISPTNVVPVTYITNNYYYHFEYSNTTIDNRTYNKVNNSVKINNTNINVGEQYFIKGGKTYINCELINAEMWTQEFKLCEGKNIVEFEKDGHKYQVELWAYKKARDKVKVQNKITLAAKKQTVIAETLPTTGEGQPTVYIIAGSIIIILGLGFLAKKVIL